MYVQELLRKIRGERSSIPEWCKDHASKILQIQFWNMTLTSELLILILVRSFRQSDFKQYTAALMAITLKRSL